MILEICSLICVVTPIVLLYECPTYKNLNNSMEIGIKQDTTRFDTYLSCFYLNKAHVIYFG